MKTANLKQLLLLFLIVCSASVVAKPPTLRQIFMSLPNSVLPVDSAHRSDLMAYYYDKKVDSVPNGMNGYIRIQSWDENTHHFVLETSRMGTFELQVFTNEQPAFIGVSKTVCAPACLSSLSFYSMDWERLPLKAPEIQEGDFLKKDLSADESDFATSWMTPLFIRFSFDSSQPSIIATCDQKAFLSEDSWKQLQPDLKTLELRFTFHQGQWMKHSL
jgi:hypothetical protein